MTTARDLATSAIKIAIPYGRVSTLGQEGELGRQWERLAILAAKDGYTLLPFETEVQQGTLSSADDRPVLHSCLRRAKENGYKILAADPSRISRNGKHAKQLHDAYPDMFVFDDCLSAYEGQPWWIEVAEHHEHFRTLVGIGTKSAIDKLKRAGQEFGPADGGKAGNEASALVRSKKSRSLVERMADYLAIVPNQDLLSRMQIGEMFTAVGIHPARSTNERPKPWTKGSITKPLGAARAILMGNAKGAQTSASYGSLIDSEGQAVGDVDALCDTPGSLDAAEIEAMAEHELMKDNPLWGRF
ncbi:recombinase family protein [Loktanella sp. R86503]|uniref:recombinase family protein n=1 Tax=Loktanella sp. R86503 TaxID=3093847 RepID=UPI0036DBD07A